jgi:hypothetical protein
MSRVLTLDPNGVLCQILDSYRVKTFRYVRTMLAGLSNAFTFSAPVIVVDRHYMLEI